MTFSESSRHRSVTAIAGCLLAFAALTGLVTSNTFADTDIMILHWLADQRSAWLTHFFTSMTALGAIDMLVVLGMGIVGTLLLAKRPGIAVAVVASLVGSALISFGLKLLHSRARPEELLRVSGAHGYSFPSGHTLTATAFWMTITLLCASHVVERRPRRFLLGFSLSIMVLVAISRMYLGVHYPSDVLGGGLLGIALALTIVLVEWRVRHGGAHPAREMHLHN